MNKQDLLRYADRQLALFATQKTIDGWLYYEDEHNPEKYSHHFLWIDRPGFTQKNLTSYLSLCQARSFVRFHVNEPSYFPHLPIPGYLEPKRNVLIWMVRRVFQPPFTIKPTSLTIKKVNVFDSTFFAWLKQSNLEYGEAYATSNANRIVEVSQKHQNFIHLLAINEGAIIGQLTIYLWEKVAELDEFYVLDRHQGKGVGHQLYQSGMAMLYQKGIKEVFLVTDPSQPAKLIYDHWGFLTVASFEQIHYQRLEKAPHVSLL